MSCRDEATPSDHAHAHHSHSHSHGGHDGHDHGDDPQAEDAWDSASLLSSIDVPKCRALNEEIDGSVRGLFRPWHKRLETPAPPCRSDADETLMVHVAFTGCVSLLALVVIGGGQGASPRHVKMYCNRPALDFGSIDSVRADQSTELIDDGTGRAEYAFKPVFRSCHHLTLLFDENFGSDKTELRFVGLKGKLLQARREPVVTAYESRPMPKDHKTQAENAPSMGMGM